MKYFLLFIFIFVNFNVFCQNDKIIVGGDYDYPPYSFIDSSGKACGYDIDVINEIAKITGLNIKFKLSTWEIALTSLKNAQIDVLTGIVYSSEREKIYDFSFPLHTEYYAIFARKESSISDINDLTSRKPAILLGDISNELFFKPMNLFHGFDTVSSFPEALHKVASGKVDYVVVPYPLGMKVINDEHIDNIEVKGPSIVPIVYCLAVKEGNYELLAWLNQGIEILSRNGKLEDIYNKWVKYKRDDKPYESFFYYMLFVLFLLLSTVIILFLFNSTLKKQVHRKALEIKAKEHAGYLKLEEAKKKIDIANNAKGVFLSTISHEIRTPLFGILGYTDLLSKTKLTSKQFTYNNNVKISANLLLNLVNDVLDITKIEASKLKLKIQNFNLKEIIEDICKIEGIKAIEKGIDFDYFIDNNIPVSVEGDKIRLSQIILNLVNNAIKFTNKGKVFVKVSIENYSIQDKSDLVKILFSIKDTGIGISLKSQEKLFKPFEQVFQMNMRKYGGTGLGLAISKQLIELMGGQILVESTEGQGSIFIVSIPFKVSTQILHKNVSEKQEFTFNKNISILLVEDNPFNAEILIEQLLSANFKVTHAQSGFDAIEILKYNCFDVVLMDIEMPKMNGFETFVRIKSEKLSDAPVIALSAHNMQSEKEKAIAIGMDDYLCKPVFIDKLSCVIYKKITKNSISCIDNEKGMAYFDNNKEKYFKALSRFKKYFKDTPNEIESLYHNNPELIKNITHSLKAAAVSIGAVYLSDLSKKYDQVLRTKPEKFTLADMRILIDELNNVLDKLNV